MPTVSMRNPSSAWRNVDDDDLLHILHAGGASPGRGSVEAPVREGFANAISEHFNVPSAACGSVQTTSVTRGSTTLWLGC